MWEVLFIWRGVGCKEISRVYFWGFLSCDWRDTVACVAVGGLEWFRNWRLLVVMASWAGCG